MMKVYILVDDSGSVTSDAFSSEALAVAFKEQCIEWEERAPHVSCIRHEENILYPELMTSEERYLFGDFYDRVADDVFGDLHYGVVDDEGLLTPLGVKFIQDMAQDEVEASSSSRSSFENFVAYADEWKVVELEVIDEV